MTPAIEMAQSAFQPLLIRLNDEGQRQCLTPAAVRNLLSACRFGSAVLDGLWEVFQGFLRHGMESRKLGLLLKELIEIIDLVTTGVYAKVRAIASKDILPVEERQSSLGALAEFDRRAAARRDELASLQRWLDRPPPAVDVTSFTSPANPSQPGYEDLDHIIARLQAGADL